jgi:hypothetical protein
MQTFRDTATLKIWQFEDDVIVTETNGVYSFKAPNGMVLNTSSTLQPYTIPVVEPTFAQIQTQALAQVDGWLTQKLVSTDWVITKINENNILGKQNTLATQYATQLNQRQTYRQTAQTVKQQITAATTQQEIQTALSALT